MLESSGNSLFREDTESPTEEDDAPLTSSSLRGSTLLVRDDSANDATDDDGGDGAGGGKGDFTFFWALRAVTVSLCLRLFKWETQRMLLLIC